MAHGQRLEVRFRHHEENGTWWADSVDWPGFYAAGETAAECKSRCEAALAESGIKPERVVHVWGDLAEGA